jgi:hypothetical protein
MPALCRLLRITHTTQNYFNIRWYKKVAKKAAKNGSESTKRLLQVIVALLLRLETKDKLSLKQQIEILDDLGLRPAEMADILNRSNIHISKELSGIRKGRKKD